MYLELVPGSTEKYFDSKVRKSPFCLILDPGYGTESSEKYWKILKNTEMPTYEIEWLRENLNQVGGYKEMSSIFTDQ